MEHRYPRAISLCSLLLVLAITFVFFSGAGVNAQNRPAWTADEGPIADQIGKLRSLPDDVRAGATKDLAIRIRQLSTSPNRLTLAYELATLSTEGDFGHDPLEEVATTLAAALHERPAAGRNGQPGAPYMELAELVRYEHVRVSLDDPQFPAAVAKLADADKARERADFTLTDLDGKTWTLQQLRGKVVLVNFWATWCPPCRKEMPDLDKLYRRFKNQGFVVLAISDEDMSKVRPFIAQERVSYPVMLDPGRKVNEEFQVDGIPKSFVYDRDGKLVTESIDMRTEGQFLAMLAQAGLK
jgi:peroxiredoxin